MYICLLVPFGHLETIESLGTKHVGYLAAALLSLRRTAKSRNKVSFWQLLLVVTSLLELNKPAEPCKPCNAN